jgi:N-acetylmuramoyl-L-alanine amidase
MSKPIIALIALLFFSSTWQLNFAQGVQYELKTVVLDAGHGGKDPGAVVGGVREKDIVLKVALKAGELIKKAYPNVNVVYTRDKDVFVNLSERAGMANRHNADLFISIHANYFQNPAIAGTETYLLGLHRTKENLELAKLENSVILLEEDYSTRYEGFDPNLAESYIMFELIQDEFLEQSRQFAVRLENQFKSYAIRPSRGVKQAGFLVLRNTTMPSVLIELGYLSNEKDRAFMQTENGIQLLGESIFQAFDQYKNSLEGKTIASAPDKAPVNLNKEKPAQEKVPAPVTPTAEKKEKTEVLAENQKQAVQGSGVNKEKTNNGDVKVEQADIKQASPSEKIRPVSDLPGIWFGIQIFVSSKAIKNNDQRIAAINELYYIEEGGLHKYVVALSQKNSETKSQLATFRSNFNGAFMVAFQNGKKVDVAAATQNQH